ncbi:NADH dehydrogenase [ubiquinone] 1 beta subcomplex subunit 11, mitochondrial [Copidosoma floridanum]|uniref:NADH dehydrogenase [ubiquinone] 1 beta subcomplex subunit 11, mitochondrial n=1 Tax=Copidosoma floridanum TaxID=29053 RepID=UPI0006C9D0F2|nr:NADH dehydrogenase [ubiquinone] 1 beta subcomplex subunit 11, mitochondrial [Copidosoma floridanum]
MANLVRLRALQGLVNVSRVARGNVNKPCHSTNTCVQLSQLRGVGTSGTQKSDNQASMANSSMEQYTEPDPAHPKKCWVSYGFDDTSEYIDRRLMHLFYLFGVSLVLIGGSWVMIYIPDNRYKDWAQREAYLRLREREAAGLPPITLNVIDEAKVKLPTDEELGDTDVII